MACETRGLQGNRKVRQPATKIIPYALGQRTGDTRIGRVVDENNPVEMLTMKGNHSA